MNESRKRFSTGFKAVFGLTVFNFLVFAAFFIAFCLLASKTNDADFENGFFEVLKYHFSDIQGLFTFNFHEGSNVIYFSLTGFLYFLIFIAVFYLTVGIVIMVKKNRRIVLPGIITSLFVVLIFILVATGLPKYWLIFKQSGAFKDENGLLFVTFGILIFAVLFSLCAYILYFYGLYHAIKTTNEVDDNVDNNNEDDFVESDDSDAVLFEELNLEEIKQSKPANNDDFMDSLKEAIRAIVREELAKIDISQNKEPTIIQNFYGVSPTQIAPESKDNVEGPTKEVEEKIEEPIIEEVSPINEVVEPVIEKQTDKKPIIRIPFTTRMLSAGFDMQQNYNELKNEIMSYGVNSRVSNSGDTFRLHRQTFIKITIAGLSLKLYFALNPDDYSDSTLPIQDAGHKGVYADTPLVFKVKSGLSMRRCKQLIKDVFEKNNMIQSNVINRDWVKELNNTNDIDD